MPEKEIDRKVAIILATDVVNYSKHMEANESETVKNLRACELILRKVIKKHDGRLFNSGGDSFFIEFPSAVEAVECSVAFQKDIKKRNRSKNITIPLDFRIGISMGDVIKEKENLLGDGVNIAARLEALAQTNGITISKNIYDLVKAKTVHKFNDLGIQKVKKNEFHAYDILLDQSQKRKLKTRKSHRSVLAIVASFLIICFATAFFTYNNQSKNEKTSEHLKFTSNTLAIVPFTTASKDDLLKTLTQGIFFDMTSNLNNSLMKLNVFPLQKVPDNLKEVVKKIGAGFVITGNIQEANNKLRININILDGKNLSVAWSKTYKAEYKVENIFDVQDLLVNEIIDEFIGRGYVLEQQTLKIASKKNINDLSTYECLTKATSISRNINFSKYPEAKACLKKSILSEPNVADLYAILASIKNFEMSAFSLETSLDAINEITHLVDKAISLDPNNLDALDVQAHLAFQKKDWENMYNIYDKIFLLSNGDLRYLSNAASHYLWGGTCTLSDYRDKKLKLGEYKDGICRWKKAYDILIEVEKLDQLNLIPSNYPLATMYQFWEEFINAELEMGKVKNPSFHWNQIHLANIKEGKNDFQGAEEHVKELIKIYDNNDLNIPFKFHSKYNQQVYWDSFSKATLLKYGFEEK